MDHQYCPGSKLLRQPAPEIFLCSGCGGEVEIWTDEFKRTCSSCGTVVYRDNTMSCLDWCKHGKECVGDTVFNNHMENKTAGMKQKLLNELYRFFEEDRVRITHAEEVLRYAETLLEREPGDRHIVVPASILHDVGIKAAEEKYGSSAGPYQEQEGPPIAREILLQFGFKIEDIDEICDIIAHHHSPGKTNSNNFKILYDADRIVNLRKEMKDKDPEYIRKILDKSFLTTSGKKLAMEEYA